MYGIGLPSYRRSVFFSALVLAAPLLARADVRPGADPSGRPDPIALQNEIWSEDWANGWGDWSTSGGVWEVGSPTSGPGSAYSDTMCAATVLDGNYPAGANSRLISPSIALPPAPADGMISLYIRQWFDFYSDDVGFVEMSVDGGQWQAISGQFRLQGGRWTQYMAGLPDSVFGRSVRFAFHIWDLGEVSPELNSGWYLDDIRVLEGRCGDWPPEDFERDFGCWYADRGVWEVGPLTSGPYSAYRGYYCAGTVLNGDYPASANSRLVSPAVTCAASPADGELWLRFWHWFDLHPGDVGFVEMSVDGGGWQNISGQFRLRGACWTQHLIGLPDSVFGRSVRFAFHILDNGEAGESQSGGWYIDEIDLVEGGFEWQMPESFTDTEIYAFPAIGGWYADRGVWEIGQPASGPGNAHGSPHCAGTVLRGDYPDAANSRLVSPSVECAAAPADGVLHLRFWHWFDFHGEDIGYVEMSVEGGLWKVISDQFRHEGAQWTPYMIGLPDSVFGRSVRFAFHIVDNVEAVPEQSSGWYIDDVELVEGHASSRVPVTFDENRYVPEWGGWYADGGVWDIGIPDHGIVGPYEGNFCAGTVLSGPYPAFTSSRLISPVFPLHPSPIGGELRLSFRHWFDLYPDDGGFVEISVDGGPWQVLSGQFLGQGGCWSQHLIGLPDSTFGRSVRFAFHIVDIEGAEPGQGNGWYIDNVSVAEGPEIFNNVEDFEDGVRGWYAASGIWEIGEPTAGPGAAYSGSRCAGTVLSGSYPDGAQSGLVSPVVTLPAAPPEGMLTARFHHWYMFAGDSDNGTLQASFSGNAWVTIGGPFTGSSGGWNPFEVDISSHAGEEARFRFWITDTDEVSPIEDSGWYIDDFEIVGADIEEPDAPVLQSVVYSSGAPALTWSNPAGDFDHICIYAGQSPDFTPDIGNRIALVSGAAFDDAGRSGWGTYYKISAIKQYPSAWHESLADGLDQITDAQDDHIPPATRLMQNYPNPFNPLTSISFDLSKQGHVRLSVYNVAGMRVARLVDENMPAGRHSVQFNAQGLASGLYFYRLETPENVQTRKMVLLR